MNIVECIKEKDELTTYFPATLDSIKQAEKDLNVTFSREYVDYIKAFGIAVFDSHELTGICDGKRLDVVLNTAEQRALNPFVHSDLYVVECLDIEGIIIWQDEKGKIYQTYPNGKIEVISNSLVEYLNRE